MRCTKASQSESGRGVCVGQLVAQKTGSDGQGGTGGGPVDGRMLLLLLLMMLLLLLMVLFGAV